MPNVTINKQTLMTIVAQLKGNVALEAEVVQKLLDQMPYNYAKAMVSEEYYEKYYRGIYYKLEHVTYTNRCEYFTEMRDVVLFLIDNNVEGKRLNSSSVASAIAHNKPLSGYTIKKIDKQIDIHKEDK